MIAAAHAAQPLTPPAIGAPWPGQGGIYAGVCRGSDGQPDHHLVLASAKPADPLNWQDGLNWAHSVEVDGHADFDMPTRFESAVLFGNVGDLFEPRFYWTSTQYSAGYAFSQLFDDGSQVSYDKKATARVRAVRRLPVNPSVLQGAVTAETPEVAT